MASRKIFRHFLRANFFTFILLISNHTVFLVQFGVNLHLWVFQKAEITLAEAACAISVFWKTHSCKLIPNWTRNRMITYILSIRLRYIPIGFYFSFRMCLIMALIRCKDIENCWRVYVLSTHCYSSIFRRLGIKACLVMTPLLGITWLFGLLTPLHKAFIYIFTILNSTQVNYLCLFK